MLVDQLIRHEGLRLKPYADSVGKITIGVGRNLSDNGISHTEAMQLLDHDLDDVVADLATFPWFARLDSVRQRALVDMRFNLGPTRFRSFKRMLAAVAAGDYVKASEQMAMSKWATQVKTRAQTLVRMMGTGLAVLFLATAAFAQSQADVVAAVKAQLQAQGMNLSGPCGAFAITKRVAWQLRAEGAGLLSKPGGNNCEGYSVDYIVYPTGRAADILGDAGGANTPAWSEEQDSELIGRWRPAVDPGGATPITGPPVPIPGTTVPSVGTDVSEVLIRVRTIEQAVADIRQQNLLHETAEAVERAKADQFREDVKSAWRDRFVWAGKYLAPLVGGVLTGLKLH